MNFDRPLNTRQKAFVDHYLLNANATLSAKEAGYSEKCAGSIGSELLQNPRIQSAIKDAQVFYNGELGDEREAILDQIEKFINRYNRLKQGSVVAKFVDLKARIKGCLVEKKEITGKDGGPIEFSDKSTAELRESIKRSITRLNEGTGGDRPN